jgi:1-acyl-sn-glycerol-3-phosphate acyltransferase
MTIEESTPKLLATKIGRQVRKPKANHISNIDFTVTASVMAPVIMNFVVGTCYFRMRFLKGILQYMGCVPKEQFQPDRKAIKNIISIIQRGGVVALYPAGQSTFDGESTHILNNITVKNRK